MEEEERERERKTAPVWFDFDGPGSKRSRRGGGVIRGLCGVVIAGMSDFQSDLLFLLQ